MDAVDRIIEALTPLAEKIGEGAVEVYKLAVRQAMMEGIVQIVFGSVALIVMGILIKAGRWAWRRAKEEHARFAELEHSRYQTGPGEAWEIRAVCTWIAAALSFFFGLDFMRDGFLWLANPKWQAIQVLLDTVRGG